mgnify:CR=1 FL=1
MTVDNSDSLTLRVAKAIPSDVGHGRARVPFDNDLNLKPGDIIEVSGAVSYTHLTLPTKRIV